ncbi:MAG: hypothetical protein WC728_13875 [Elusimicrobiota bacterium]
MTLSASLAHAAGPVARQLWLASGADPIPAAGAPVAGSETPAQQDPNAVLGLFQGADDTLFWFMKDAGLNSRSVSQQLAQGKQGQRNVGTMLRDIQGGWLILRDPIKDVPHYTFLDPKDKKVYYIPLESVAVGDKTLRLNALGKDSVQSDQLFVSYGDAKDGPLVFQQLQPDVKAVDKTLAVFDHKGGKLTEGILFDAEFLKKEGPRVFEPVKAALTKKEGDSPSALEKMEKFLKEKPDRSILVSPAGADGFLFKQREGEKETLYVYVKGDSVKEFPVR